MSNIGTFHQAADVSQVTALRDPQPLVSHASQLLCIFPINKPSNANVIDADMFSIILIFLLVGLFVIPFTALILGPRIVQAAGQIIGWYLRRKTDGRRSQILERVQEEEKTLEAKGGRRDSDEWENVESYTVGSSQNGEKADIEWAGIVGFFHPFWYAPTTHRMPFLTLIATLVVAEKEFFGQQYELHRNAGPMRHVSFTLEITTLTRNKS